MTSLRDRVDPGLDQLELARIADQRHHDLGHHRLARALPRPRSPPRRSRAPASRRSRGTARRAGSRAGRASGWPRAARRRAGAAPRHRPRTPRASASISSGSCGRNSCSGGSSSRIVTGSPAMISNSSTKSWRCIGRILASAARRPSASSARIISRIAPGCGHRRRTCARCGTGRCPRRRSGARCGHRAGVSALARTLSRRRSSAQPISVAKSPDSLGSTVGTAPSMTVAVAAVDRDHVAGRDLVVPTLSAARR